MMLLDDNVTQDNACHIFRAMHEGEKPFLNPALTTHRAVINTLKKMRQSVMITEGADIYYRDFPLNEGMTPVQQARYSSFTGVQPLTWHMTEVQKKVQRALKGVGRNVSIFNQDAFDRFLPLEGRIDPSQPTVIHNGGLDEAAALCRAIDQRLEYEDAAILYVYNEDGLWDDILRDKGVSSGRSNIRIATTEKELRDIVRETAYANNVVSFKKATKPENPFAFAIRPESTGLIGSGNSKKRYDIVRPFNGNQIDMIFRNVNDAVGVLINAPEEQKTAAGNGKAKKYMVIRLLDNNAGHMRAQNMDPDNSNAFVSDIVMACAQPGIEDHPLMQRYGHVLVPGQAFPGSEMANVEKVDNLQTLFHTLNQVFDDMESRGIPVDRRISIQTVLYIFPVNQPLPQNPDDSELKYMAVSGEQTYHILKQPSYEPEGGYDLDSFIALPDQPEVSLGQRQLELGKLHPDTHNVRVYEALAHALPLPVRALDRPYVTKPKLKEVAEIVTDRHFLGSWTTARDQFTKAALEGFENAGYRFAEENWQGPRDFAAIEHFRKGRQGFITMPYDYSNPGDDRAKLEEKVLRDILLYALDVDRELGEPHMRGRPHVVMDRRLMELREHSFRIGLAGTHPKHGTSWMLNESANIAALLDAAWLRHEYCYSPHTPVWEHEPVIPADLGKEATIALLGSAKSHDAFKIEESARLAEMVIEAGYGVRDGHGGEGDMGGFATGVARATKRYNDVAYYGVTTPLAAIEKEPTQLYKTYLRDQHASLPTMYQRAPGIFQPDVAAGIYRPGGNGTGQEFFPALTNVQGKTNTLLIVDTTPVRLADQSTTAFGVLWSKYSAREKEMAGIVEAQGVDAAFAIADAHIKARRTQKAPALRA